MLPYLKEFYMVSDQPVVVVMTSERIGLQAWYADLVQHKMKRHDELLVDIICGNHSKPLRMSEFDAYCTQHKINPALPEKSIELSFSLAQTGPKAEAAYIPPPAVTFAGNQQSGPVCNIR